ncbi:MAG: hypothetical protein O2968_22585 [Acidobacteria bacterium]|nr:hypothetical protein [Acidobacteriota bacterium]
MTRVPGHLGQPGNGARRGKEKGRSWFSIELLILWIGMLWALPNRGGSGIVLVVGASLLATLTLPLEYAAVAATAPALLPTLFGGLPPWYMGTFRWVFLFAGAAILIVRCLSAKTPRSGGTWSSFTAALTAFVTVAAFSAMSSVSPSSIFQSKNDPEMR